MPFKKNIKMTLKMTFAVNVKRLLPTKIANTIGKPAILSSNIYREEIQYHPLISKFLPKHLQGIMQHGKCSKTIVLSLTETTSSQKYNN